jgi:hypothetical protein
MLSLKDMHALLQQRRSATERLMKELTAILRELGYQPTPLRSTTARRISTGLLTRPSPPAGTYTCETCHRSFRFLMHLGRHKQIAHAGPEPQIAGKTRKVKA